MPTASRNERKKRRQKRTSSLLKRVLKQTEFQRQQAMILLLAVLAQHGGEFTIVKGTIAQVMTDFQYLGFESVKGATENEVVVRMVSNKSVTATTDDPQIRQTPEMAVVDASMVAQEADGAQQPTV